MKKVSIILSLSLVSINYFAQQVNYKILKDEPKNITNFSCNLDLAQMDAGLSNIDGLSFNIGVWGHAMFKNKLGLDYTYRYGWLTFGKLASTNVKNHINIQTGGFFIFSERNKLVNTRVVLKSEAAGTTSDGRAITRVTSIRIPSNAWKYKAIRGGIYFNRGVLSIENPTGKDFYGNYYSLGIYGGICFGRTLKLSVQTDKYGIKGFAFHSRFSLDALLLPINNIPSTIKNKSPIGGRMVWQVIPSITRKEGKKNFNTSYNKRLAAEVELGYRGVEGFYVAGTISIPIARTLKVLGAEEDQNNKRTTE